MAEAAYNRIVERRMQRDALNETPVPLMVADLVAAEVWNALSADQKAAVEAMLEPIGGMPSFLKRSAMDAVVSFIESL